MLCRRSLQRGEVRRMSFPERSMSKTVAMIGAGPVGPAAAGNTGCGRV